MGGAESVFIFEAAEQFNDPRMLDGSSFEPL